MGTKHLIFGLRDLLCGGHIHDIHDIYELYLFPILVVPAEGDPVYSPDILPLQLFAVH